MALRPNAGLRMLATLVAAPVLVISACTNNLPVASAPADGIALDGLAQIDVSPVNYGGLRVVTAAFGTIVPGREVALQRKTTTGWQDVATASQDAYGEVEFKVDEATKETYRVVALATAGQSAEPAVTTSPAKAGDIWNLALSSDFSGDELQKKHWRTRGAGAYDSSGRHCSAQYESNVKVIDGKAELSVTKETDAEHVAAAKAAGCEEAGFFRNAMISTANRFTVTSGLVAARIKAPAGQGMHGGLWLQADANNEIHVVDFFGYGRGLSNVAVIEGKRYPASNDAARVVNEQSKDAKWWSKYHVYSVEWDTNTIIFRIDGEQTRRIDQESAEVNYFLALSLLSSDWEQKQFETPVQGADDVQPTTLPQTMSVDWVKVWIRD